MSSSKNQQEGGYFQKIPWFTKASIAVIIAAVIGSYTYYKKYIAETEEYSSDEDTESEFEDDDSIPANTLYPNFEHPKQAIDRLPSMKSIHFPDVKLEAIYIGNSLVELGVTDMKPEKKSDEDTVPQCFELQYRILTTSQHRKTLLYFGHKNDNIKWKSLSFSATKINWDYGFFHIRVPQSITEYFLQLRIRFEFSENEQQLEATKWSAYTVIKPVMIPFDDPTTLKIGLNAECTIDKEKCKYMCKIKSIPNDIYDEKTIDIVLVDEFGRETLQQREIPLSDLYVPQFQMPGFPRFIGLDTVQIGQYGECDIEMENVRHVCKIIDFPDHKTAVIRVFDEFGRERQTTRNVPIDTLKPLVNLPEHVVDIMDWNCIFDNLLLPVSDMDIDYKLLFVTLKSIFETHAMNLYKDIINEYVSDDNRNWISSSLMKAELFAASHDVARFVSYEVIDFLHDDEKGCDMKVKSVHCGLCLESNHYRCKLECKRIWNVELCTVMAWIEKNKDKLCDQLKESFYQILDAENDEQLISYCGICSVGFGRYDYGFVCEKESAEHMICLCCVNKIILKYKQLMNILDETYDIHGLTHDCIMEIVYCVIGWVHDCDLYISK